MKQPVDPDLCVRLAREYGTPFYLYDAGVIRARIAELRGLRRDPLRAEGLLEHPHAAPDARRGRAGRRGLAAASSSARCAPATRAAGEPAGLVYTADVIDEATLERVIELDIPVNAGSTDMLEQLGRRQPGHRVWLRVNPGFGHGHSRKTNTGGPWSKHGIWHAYLDEALRARREVPARPGRPAHAHRLGRRLRAPRAACATRWSRRCARSASTCARSRAAAACRSRTAPATRAFDTAALHRLWDAARREIEAMRRAPGVARDRARPLPGRRVGRAGRARCARPSASARNRFLLVDAGFNDLIRPAMYGSYHEISIVRARRRRRPRRRPSRPSSRARCASRATCSRRKRAAWSCRASCPTRAVGDLVVLHDAGAYGASQASNYNTRAARAGDPARGGRVRADPPPPDDRRAARPRGGLAH